MSPLYSTDLKNVSIHSFENKSALSLFVTTSVVQSKESWALSFSHELWCRNIYLRSMCKYTGINRSKTRWIAQKWFHLSLWNKCSRQHSGQHFERWNKRLLSILNVMPSWDKRSYMYKNWVSLRGWWVVFYYFLFSVINSLCLFIYLFFFSVVTLTAWYTLK